MITREEMNKKKFDEIMNEEMRLKRKKIVILFFKIVLFIVLFMTCVFFYTTYISTKRVVVKENRIINKNIPSNFDGLKIIQISDLHYGSTIFKSDVKQLIKSINVRNPDLVFFTGDLIDKNYKITSKEQEDLINQLKSIKSTIGKYAVAGEEDDDQFSTILNQSQFTILNNDYDLIYNDNNSPILLVGLSSLLSDTRDIDKAYNYFNLESHNSNIYTICILHEPDSVDEILSKYKTDLFLAGHSHNGQIRIPFIGALKRKNGAKEYYEEYYKLNNSKLFISSGLGTDESGFRLFDRPSFNFFRLSSK